MNKKSDIKILRQALNNKVRKTLNIKLYKTYVSIVVRKLKVSILHFDTSVDFQ